MFVNRILVFADNFLIRPIKSVLPAIDRASYLCGMMGRIRGRLGHYHIAPRSAALGEVLLWRGLLGAF